MAAIREIGYDDYLTGEFGVYRHAPEVMLGIRQRRWMRF
jgi:hypothetical protein